jgi:hypothetical protein
MTRKNLKKTQGSTFLRKFLLTVVRSTVRRIIIIFDNCMRCAYVSLFPETNRPHYILCTVRSTYRWMAYHNMACQTSLHHAPKIKNQEHVLSFFCNVATELRSSFICYNFSRLLLLARERKL